MGEMAVIRRPERDQIGPRHTLVLLSSDPLVLPIAFERSDVRRLQHHEAAMVVARRVDQMSQHFAGAPPVWLRPRGGPAFVDPAEGSERLVNSSVKLCRYLCGRHRVTLGEF